MRSEVTIAVYESSNHVAYPNAVFRDLTDCTLLGYWQSADRFGYGSRCA